MADVGHSLEIELHRDWVLITYDIPRAHDGVRKKVIRELQKMGALRHTDSVYYLPYNSKACDLAATLPGQAYVWRAGATSDSQAKRLTQDYYDRIEEGLQKIRERLDTLEEELPEVSPEAMQDRLNYTIQLFESLKAAANNIGLLVYEGLSDVGQKIEAVRERVFSSPEGGE